MVNTALKPENAAQPVFGPSFPLICMEDVDNDAFVAGVVERGPATKSTRVEQLGD